jgi:glutamine synthetase
VLCALKLARSGHDEQLPILRIEKERGEHQYEIVTAMTASPAEQVAVLSRVRSIIEKYGQRFDVPVHFDAKPYADQPSSGLHIHLHLADDQGLNAYHKTEAWMSDALRWSLGGMLEQMPADMAIFFPHVADYARLSDIDHVPKIYGWGVNNRYCALRIPAYPDPYDKRIEHRVPCANADPYRVMVAILSAVLKGLREQIEPSPQEYGKTSSRNLKQLALTALV